MKLIEASVIGVGWIGGGSAQGMGILRPLAILRNPPLTEGLRRHVIPLHLVQLAVLDLLWDSVDRGYVVQHLYRAFVVPDLTGQPYRAQTSVVQRTPGEVGAGIGDQVVVVLVEAVLFRGFSELHDLVVLFPADFYRALVARISVDQIVVGINFTCVRVGWRGRARISVAFRIASAAIIDREEHVPHGRVLEPYWHGIPFAPARRSRSSHMDRDGETLCSVLLHLSFSQ
ncbi:hypothetical protein D3C71_1412560 [compost metagenome]